MCPHLVNTSHTKSNHVGQLAYVGKVPLHPLHTQLSKEGLPITSEPMDMSPPMSLLPSVNIPPCPPPTTIANKPSKLRSCFLKRNRVPAADPSSVPDPIISLPLCYVLVERSARLELGGYDFVVWHVALEACASSTL